MAIFIHIRIHVQDNGDSARVQFLLISACAPFTPRTEARPCVYSFCAAAPVRCSSFSLTRLCGHSAVPWHEGTEARRGRLNI